MVWLPRAFLHWLAMRSLRTQLIITTLGMLLGALSLLVMLSLHRLEQRAENDGLQWASALAATAARTSEPLVQDPDLASLESSLQEIMNLPGVVAIDVHGAGGTALLQFRRNTQGAAQIIRPTPGPAPPSPSTEPQWLHPTHSLRVTASLLAAHRLPDAPGPAPQDLQRNGWLTLEYSYDQRLRQARSAWWETAALSVVLLSLSLAVFAAFLRRTVQPLRALARYASQMARHPGQTLQLRWGSQEVRELGRTLNWASQELSRRMAETHKRLLRIRAVLDTAADAIVGVDANGVIVGANPAAERMFGLSETQLQGQALTVILPGQDAERLHQTMADGMLIHSTQSRIGRVEMDAMRHGGTAFPVEVLLGEIPDDPEIRYTCIVRDLTDMKLAEEYLTLYGRVLDCSPTGVSVSDARRYPQPIVHVNPAFTRITGYAPHEVLGRDASLLEGPLTDAHDLAQLARVVKDGGEIRLTLHNYRKDGSLFHNKLSVSPVRDAQGQITHYINVIEDVTAQMEVKQRLIERTARLNATFDLSPDGFAVFDAQGELITSNPALRQMIGELPVCMPLTQFDTWMASLCEEAERYAPIAQATETGHKHTLVLARPSRKVLERDVRRHMGGSGETFVYFRDVTHQHEVDQMKSEFLATAAHELRTPLASILGFTELMIHRKYSEEKQKDMLQTVHRQGALLNGLIQELLDLSRIEARQGKDFHIVPTDLSAIVEASVKGITNQELGREVHMAPLPAVQVMADASKIEQALTNLLSNAFKYSPNGGEVHLLVEQTERDGEACAVIRVKDHGMGMTPAQLARAFERFYRADTSGNIPGTGLGLNLVKEIAEIHGGGVELSSEPGVGTTASLWLKVASTPVVQETEADNVA